MAGNTFTYRAFGLTLSSAFALPDLLPATAAADVQIRFGGVPPALESPALCKVFYQVRDNEWLLNTERIAGARFLVRDGNEIVIERAEAHADDVVRLFLLGSCMGALLTQRGIMPLHGNAIATPRGAAVLAGGIGSGKSTLAMALLRRGHRLLADDISAVSQANGASPLVQPGFPRLKLWADTCRQFGLDIATLPRIRPELEKYHYPVADRFCAEPRPLHAVYLLTPEPIVAPVLEPLQGVAKMKELQAQLYKVGFKEARKHWPWLFPRMAALARQTRVCIVRRPSEGFEVEALADLIEGDLAP